MDLTIFKSNLEISTSTNRLSLNIFIWFHSNAQGYLSFAKKMLTENIFRNLRFDYTHNTSKISNLHYHEYNEETPWKLYIPLVRSGGYRLTSNPGESLKEDMNSQLDILHINDEQVWSLTKVQIFFFEFLLNRCTLFSKFKHFKWLHFQFRKLLPSVRVQISISSNI